MKIDGVVFDLDHTLFDRYETVKLCTPVIYEKYKDIFNEEYTLEKFTTLYTETDKKKIHYGWDAVFDEYIRRGLIKEGCELPRKEFLDTILSSCKIYSVKYDFTQGVLEELKRMNLKIGLITNGASDVQRAKLKNLDIEEYFDCICISGEVGYEKPDTKIFDIMSEKLNIAPSRLLYVGDHPLNDATTSQKAGYIPILVMTMGFETMPCAKNFDMRINNVSELPLLIKEKFM